MTDASDHDRLIHAIYDAADEPSGFGGVLEQMGGHLGAKAAHTLVLPVGASRVESHSYGGDERAFAEYAREWKGKDPRFALAVKRPGEVLSDVTVIDSAEFERSALYNELLLAHDVRYTLFGAFAPGPELVLTMAFMRAKRRGAFGVEEIARMASSAPHLARAVRLRHLVGSLRDDVADLRRALDHVVTAAAILDRAGKVLCANAAAEALLARGDGLCTAKGKLTASMSAEARELDAAIAKAMLMTEGTTGRAPRPQLAPHVAVSRADGVAVAVTFFPLGPRNVVRNGARGARLLAIFHDPSRVVRIDPALAAKLHGLTETEAALAAALAEGKTLADFADDRGCSEQTARTHLKRVLEKTRTKRQPDLVRVLLTGAHSRGPLDRGLPHLGDARRNSRR